MSYVLPERRWKESISLSKIILRRIFLLLNRPNSFFLIAYLSFSLVEHVLNSNSLQLYRVVLLTRRFPIYYITYCVRRSTTQISEELLRASLLQLMSQGYKFESRNQVHLRTLRGVRLKSKCSSSRNWVFDPANG